MSTSHRAKKPVRGAPRRASRPGRTCGRAAPEPALLRSRADAARHRRRAPHRRDPARPQAPRHPLQPHVWLSEEWFSPDGVPGIAVPFYMAHPRLMRLERRLMHEVEGGNANWLTRILRHEIGHALDNAFRLRRRKEWRKRVRQGVAPLSGHLPAAAGEPRLRAAPRPLVRAEPSDRRLRRNLRGVAAAARRAGAASTRAGRRCASSSTSTR